MSRCRSREDKGGEEPRASARATVPGLDEPRASARAAVPGLDEPRASARAVLQHSVAADGTQTAPALPGGVVSLSVREVGEGRPVFVVAEAGVNHDGSLSKALELVQAAAQSGADAVKFQVFSADELVIAEAPTADYQRQAGEGARQRQMLHKLELSDEQWAEVFECARGIGMLCFATPFGLRDVARLARFEAPAIKIASTDVNNHLLLRAAASAGVPLIVSTGAATGAEIRASVGLLRSCGAGARLIMMHCISRYPTPLEEANLRSIEVLRREFGLPVGFSDHTESTLIGGWAVAAGACALEKHITLDRSLRGPDHAMSLNPTEFATYVASVRRVERTLGTARLGMSPAEAETRRLARKSLVAARPLKAGEVLTGDKLTAKRPGTGIGPDELDRLLGRRLAVDVPMDTPLSWEMLVREQKRDSARAAQR